MAFSLYLQHDEVGVLFRGEFDLAAFAHHRLSSEYLNTRCLLQITQMLEKDWEVGSFMTRFFMLQHIVIYHTR